MKLLSEWEMSEWAYLQCRHGNDTKEIRKLIIDDIDKFYYCWYIKDIKEMWSKIRNSYWAKEYCEYVKDRPEVRKYIKS